MSTSHFAGHNKRTPFQQDEATSHTFQKIIFRRGDINSPPHSVDLTPMDLSCDILNQEYKENIRQKMAAITETMCREVFRNAG